MSNKPKIESITVGYEQGVLKTDIALKPCDVRLDPASNGLIFLSTIAYNAVGSKGVQAYKLIRNSDHILLEGEDTSKKQTGLRRVKRYNVFPVYGDNQKKIHEQYGSMFKVEIIDKDIKLVPIYIEEVKQLQKEIISLVERYYNTEITLA